MLFLFLLCLLSPFSPFVNTQSVFPMIHKIWDCNSHSRSIPSGRSEDVTQMASLEKASVSPTADSHHPGWIDLQKVFRASPWIYSLLAIMSISSLAIWLYSLATFRPKEAMPDPFVSELKTLLRSDRHDQARQFCEQSPNLLSFLVIAGLTTRTLGPQVMIDSMKSEGKRIATPLWQRLALLNDIAIVAPMLGLLGTVIGMFYAFYDVNRSMESINALFDGLGIAVGTTVMGLIVAILAMIFSTTLKYRLIKTLSRVENEALLLSTLIQHSRDPDAGSSWN